jgi:hypothetical protein
MEPWDPAGDQVVVEDRPMYRGDGMDAVVVGYWSLEPDDAMWVAAAWNRLVAAGWTVDDLDATDPGQLGLTADKGDFHVRIWVVPWAVSAPAPGEPLPAMTPASLTLTRHRPPVTAISSAVGFVAGLLIGWQLAGWVVRRGRQHQVSRRSVILAWGAGAVLLAVLVDGMTAALGIQFIGVDQHPLMMVPTLLTSILALFAVPAVIAAAVVVAVAATRPPLGHAAPGPDRQRGRDAVR